MSIILYDSSEAGSAYYTAASLSSGNTVCGLIQTNKYAKAADAIEVIFDLGFGAVTATSLVLRGNGYINDTQTSVSSEFKNQIAWTGMDATNGDNALYGYSVTLTDTTIPAQRITRGIAPVGPAVNALQPGPLPKYMRLVLTSNGGTYSGGTGLTVNYRLLSYA